jgi:hypothetical protein
VLSSCREGAQISDVWTCLLAEDEGLKQGLSQNLLASVVHTIACADQSWQDPGTKMFPQVKALPGRVDTSPLAGKVPGCLELEKGPASEALWLPPVPEAVASVVHTLLPVQTSLDRVWEP